MAARMYLVELKRKKVLVEAVSQEAAIREATKPMVKSCIIPTPLEVARLMREGVEVIGEGFEPKPEPEGDSDQKGEGEGVGRLGLADGEQPPAGEPEE